MQLRKCLFLLFVLALCFIDSSEARTITSITQLNDPAYTVGVGEAGSAFDAVIRGLPKAKRAYIEGIQAYELLRRGRIDAYAYDRAQMTIAIANGLKGVRILPGSIGEGTEIAVGLSRESKIAGLRGKINQFIGELKASGTLDEMFRRWIEESDRKMPDIPAPSVPALKLRVGTTGIVMPYSYYEGNTLTGFDVELAKRFASWLGAELEFRVYDYSGTIAAAATGEIDCIMANLNITPERAEKIDFSETLFTEEVALMVKDDAPAEESECYSSLQDLNGKRIGVQTGVEEWADIIRDRLPDAKITYYNTFADLTAALKSGKIDAFPCDSPVLSLIMAQNDDVASLSELLEDSFDISVAFSKTENGEKLKAQWDEYITSMKEAGKIEALVRKWTGADDNAKTIKDYSSLPATNGILRMATEGEYPTFNYYRDNKLVGFEVELAVMFAEAYGYGLEVKAVSYDGIFSAVQSGRCDFAMDTLTPKDEHAEVMLFSVPYYACSTQMAVLAANLQSSPAPAPEKRARFMTISDLAGTRIGVQTGTTNDKAVAKAVPTAKIDYFDSFADILTALRQGKIDAACLALNDARFSLLSNEDLVVLDKPLAELDAAPIFPKTEAGRKLCEKFNEFIKAEWDNGTFQRMDSVWFGKDESKRTVKDYTNLPAPNGTLRMAADVTLAPFAYVKDNRIVGYEVEMAMKFCEENGYGLEVVPMSFGEIIPAVLSGKCDFASCTIAITAERAEQVLFALPNAKTGNVIVVRKSDTESDPEVPAKPAQTPETLNAPSFFDELAASFNRTFIREDRWQLFVDGIISTMIITVLSIICGTALGFIVYMSCRGGNVFANLITRFFVWLIQGTPMVVLLMILYYIIFGKVDINGMWVSVIAFSMTFGASVYGMLLSGTGALDKGQTEAAYALGFSDSRTFFTVILPQAALHFMPSYKAEVVALIKATAIVGYIAVQDLTKMGDIVRSRTYEAFFPLIAVAVIYFVLAGMLNMIVNVIHNRIRPEKRSRDDILRGIDTHD